MLLRRYLEEGKSKSALARKLGVHRHTIHRWIRAGELDSEQSVGGQIGGRRLNQERQSPSLRSDARYDWVLAHEKGIRNSRRVRVLLE